MIRYRTTTIEGQKVFYREAGDPALPALLLLHGFPASSFMYRRLLERLQHRFHLIAPDYPGFGHSDAPSADAFAYTFDHLADVVETFVDRLGLERYGLYLQDFGGPIGLRVASRRPQRVTFLIVQNANAYEEGLPDDFWAPARRLWQDPSPAHRAAIRDAAMSDQALKWNYTHGVKNAARIDPDSWLLQRSLLARPGNKEAMVDLLEDYGNNLKHYPAWQAYFRAHQPPTLLVWGANDAIFPPAGAHPYRRDLKRIDVHLLDSGHFALEELDGEIAGHIERFHASLSA